MAKTHHCLTKKHHRMSSSSGNALIGFIFGAAVGVAAGLLFAPGPGDETRKTLKKKSREYSDELARQVNAKMDELKHYVGDMADDAREKVKNATPESLK